MPPTAVGRRDRDAFVRVGLEVEEVHRRPESSGPLVVGRVLEIEELTGFKKPIRCCQVDDGEAGRRAGSSAAPRNFAVGDLVVVALPGAVLPGGFAIAARTTYGRISDGMICSAASWASATTTPGSSCCPPDAAAPGHGRR